MYRRRLNRFGIRAVIAPSFGDIHYANELQNGMLPVILPEEICRGLRDQLRGMRGLQERYQASADQQVKEELRRRFALAAAQAAALFNTIYARAVPEELMRMPAEACPEMPDDGVAAPEAPGNT